MEWSLSCSQSCSKYNMCAIIVSMHSTEVVMESTHGLGSGLSTKTHFLVPATEMHFDAPIPCPWFTGLTLDGIAGDEEGDQHLIVTLHRLTAVRAYIGPGQEAVARRAFLLTAGMLANHDLDSVEAMAPIVEWLADSWTALAAEIESLTTSLPAQTAEGLDL